MKQIDVIMFATPNLKVYTDLSIAMWEKYCETFGYNFFHYSEPYYDDLHLAWSKIRSVFEHLKSSKADYVLLVDADTIPTAFDLSVETVLEKYMTGDKEILFQKDGSDRLKFLYFPHNIPMALKSRRIILPNAGFILMKNNEAVKAFYKEWLERAQTSPYANKPPRNQNVLTFEMLVQPQLEKIVGYLDTSVINKFKGDLAIHFSSKKPAAVRDMMLPYFERLMKKERE